MAKGQSKGKAAARTAATGRVSKRLTDDQKKALAILKTATDISEIMEQRNIPQFDVDDLISEILEDELEDLEDTVEGENPDNDDFKEEYDENDDDSAAYDEIEAGDPFEVEVEEHETRRFSAYIVSVYFNEEMPVIKFLQTPQYLTNDPLVRNALIERCNRFLDMAAFIAEKQRQYLKTADKEALCNLEQQELVEYFGKKNIKLSKEHISRLLDALYFNIEGLGTIPSKSLFKRFSREQKLALAREFIGACNKEMSQLEKAKALVEFIENKRGIRIKLSAKSRTEHDKYKQWKDLLRQVDEAPG